MTSGLKLSSCRSGLLFSLDPLNADLMLQAIHQCEQLIPITFSGLFSLIEYTTEPMLIDFLKHHIDRYYVTSVEL